MLETKDFSGPTKSLYVVYPAQAPPVAIKAPPPFRPKARFLRFGNYNQNCPVNSCARNTLEIADIQVRTGTSRTAVQLPSCAAHRSQPAASWNGRLYQEVATG